MLTHSTDKRWHYFKALKYGLFVKISSSEFMQSHRPRFCYILLACGLGYNAAAHSVQTLSLSIKSERFLLQELDFSDNIIVEEVGQPIGLQSVWKNTGAKTLQEYSLNLTQGQVAYQGQTQRGRPHQTQTQQSIFDTHALWVRHWAINKQRWQLDLGPQLGWQFWARKIKRRDEIAGLAEEYDWLYISIVARSHWKLSTTWSASLAAQYGLAYRPYLHVNFEDASEAELIMGQGRQLQYLAQLEYMMSVNWSIKLAYASLVWRFQHSRSYPVRSVDEITTSIHEPKLNIRRQSLAVGFTYQFK